ncbi:glyoxylase I 4-like [Argentina anserina]|uniref:glyoxylase I 4-like n=1 Tax=Argentina anserina TaxID=57926 RepID=UPI0021762F5C|nr:glyoxylase I 4-like [Potentilla anserina]XP_050365095.1 glyoxylase I 4-like [Potentilla anserina]
MKERMVNPLQLKSLNHISLVCRSLEKSLDFYQNVLGFFPIRRPGSLDFNGAWLYNYGIGIHLLQAEDPQTLPKISYINPKANHISFQCESMSKVENKLKEMKIEYVTSSVEEGGINVDQLFFHDPDGTMIEICNCDNLPVIPIVGDQPLRSCTREKCIVQQQQQEAIAQIKPQQKTMTCLRSNSIHMKDSLPCA